jgi:hypothetical protein
MPLDLKRLILLTSITALAADKDHARFEPRPVLDYPNHQTSGPVTAAASAFETDDQARPAFGKVNPYKNGALPVLLVIRNDGKDPIRAERIQVDYIGPDRAKVENTPAGDLKYSGGVRQPRVGGPSPLPGGLPRIGGPKKSPLAEWEIEGRAWAAKMILPGETVSGFFYFQTGHRSGSKVYVSGLKNAVTGEDILYLELGLENVR